MQHDSKRWFSAQATQAVQTSTDDMLAAPMLLDDDILSQIGGGLAAITEPPTPINVEVDSPHGSWG